MEYIPYTYLIGWSKLNLWYYGVEYGVKKSPCANPANLWKTYFTSSSLVSFHRRQYGEPDVIEIRRTFTSGDIISRMEDAIRWEKTVLSRINIVQPHWLNGRIGGDICPETTKKLNLIRYGVENVFQADEIKDKIKDTNMRKFGVEHPSYSLELLAKKAANNTEKYGVSCVLTLPHIRDKCMVRLRDPDVRLQIREKQHHTNLQKYGTSYPSQSSDVKQKVLITRSQLSNRPIVALIREYCRVFDAKLGEGWYQRSEDYLQQVLNDLQHQHGDHTIDCLKATNRPKQYSAGIKKLQSREQVQFIMLYKRKYGSKIKLGRGWDRKPEEFLNGIVQRLITEYGVISDPSSGETSS